MARQLARLIDAAGGKHGLKTFLDEKDIQSGDSIPETIRENLRRCDELVVLLTRNSLHREWVLVEIAGAWVLGKRVVAVMDQVLPKELPNVIANCRAVDLNEFDTYLADVKNRAQKSRTV
ncbi:MAG: toll/interleukin-1 receptor domain-containing protein [Verrucomicrobia bacterium]|nr:toll/interleukin-1 receptor domain-containing protein [Verrucomicrobiota bacterium]